MGLKNWSFIYGFLAGSSICAIIQWVHDYRAKQRKLFLDHFDDCFFFSPKTYTIKCLKDTPGCCGLLSCPVCNYEKFLELIKSAKSSLDICVYLVTSEELTNVIVNLFKRGIFIRIITDKQMSDEALNSKMYVFFREHIPIKVINAGEMMHNKFVIIDQKKVITGSFNWTKQGMLYNYENAVLIHNEKIVRKYGEYFQEIWLSKF